MAETKIKLKAKQLVLADILINLGGEVRGGTSKTSAWF